MKIIDLLNKIANGEEVPEKIKYNNEEYKYYEGVDYRDKRGNYLLSGEPICIAFLNDEIEIIEEEKKIPEKLDQTLNRSDIGEDYYRYIMENRFKLNEIIEYLNSKGE